jgi:hypothetical protein
MIGDDTVILETVNLRLALAQQGSKIIGLSPARGLFGNTRDIYQNAHRKRQNQGSNARVEADFQTRGQRNQPTGAAREHRVALVKLPSRQADFLLGTFLPFARASESPVAIACFLLLTVLPLFPLLSVPALRRSMAPFTSPDADLEYRAIFSLLPSDPQKRGFLEEVP